MIDLMLLGCHTVTFGRGRGPRFKFRVLSECTEATVIRTRRRRLASRRARARARP